jgi:chromosome segregation ATPase
MNDINVKKTKYEELQSHIKDIAEIVAQNKKNIDEIVSQYKADIRDVQKEVESFLSKLFELKVDVLQINSKIKDNFVKDNKLGTTVQEYLGESNSAEPMIYGGVPVDINGNPLRPVYNEKKYIKPQNEILIP